MIGHLVEYYLEANIAIGRKDGSAKVCSVLSETIVIINLILIN